MKTGSYLESFYIFCPIELNKFIREVMEREKNSNVVNGGINGYWRWWLR